MVGELAESLYKRVFLLWAGEIEYCVNSLVNILLGVCPVDDGDNDFEDFA